MRKTGARIPEKLPQRNFLSTGPEQGDRLEVNDEALTVGMEPSLPCGHPKIWRSPGHWMREDRGSRDIHSQSIDAKFSVLVIGRCHSSNGPLILLNNNDFLLGFMKAFTYTAFGHQVVVRNDGPRRIVDGPGVNG